MSGTDFSLWERINDWGRRHLVLRFILGVVFLMGLFYALYLPKWKYDVVGVFLKWNLAKHAQVTGFVLNAFGSQVTVSPPGKDSGPIVRGERFAMEIVRGCDALEPTALFLAAVLAFPAPWKKKLIGMALGILLLEMTNVVRLVSLYYVGVHWRQHFEMIHLEVWQAGFIVISVAYWAAWALWATKPSPRGEPVPQTA